MFTMKEYVQATSLAQAYDLRKKSKQNVILGGNLWLKMGNRDFHTGIDLSNLGLDTIEETKDAFHIGCMCSLRMLEEHQSLHQYFQGSFKEALRHIVGVQFRNTATVGGSVFPRFGFSDVLTLLCALDTYVELYQGGMIPIKEFVLKQPDEDILVGIHIKKDNRQVCYQSHRITETDFGVLTCGVAKCQDTYTIVLGATPHKAKIVDGLRIDNLEDEKALDACLDQVISQFRFTSNMRGSAQYRKALAKVLIKRALGQISQMELKR